MYFLTGQHSVNLEHRTGSQKAWVQILIIAPSNWEFLKIRDYTCINFVAPKHLGQCLAQGMELPGEDFVKKCKRSLCSCWASYPQTKFSNLLSKLKRIHSRDTYVCTARGPKWEAIAQILLQGHVSFLNFFSHPAALQAHFCSQSLPQPPTP